MIQGKPKLKSYILKYRIKNHQIVLRFNGMLGHFEDPTGLVWSLIEMLDGKNTYAQIVENLKKQYPEIKDEAIEKHFQDLLQHNLLEDTTHTSAEVLDTYTAERWSRNMDFFGSMTPYGKNKYTYQQKIKDAKICLLGCGGVGTHVLFDLVATGFQNITIVDFDTIELSNLNRQILYHETDIGKSKVHQAKERMVAFCPKAHITPIETRLDSMEKIASVIERHDLVICVVDKPRHEIVSWLNEACVKAKIPFISGFVELRRAVFYSVIPGETGCVACWRKSVSQDNPLAFSVLEKGKNLKIDYTEPAPAMVALVSIEAGCMVAEAIKLITGLQAPSLTNKLKVYNFDDVSISTQETWQKRPECQVCGFIK
ncbi:MAG: ThiF family adenylyltransferase [Bacteroidota bacterium]